MENIDETGVPGSRYYRIWLVGLLLLTALIAGGALFAKYQLEGFRGVILGRAQTRMGADLQVEEVAAFGLRGLRAQGVHLVYSIAPATTVEFTAPEAIIYIDLVGLISGGGISVERVQVNQALVSVRREEGQAWLDPLSAGTGPQSAFLSGAVPFRVTGTDCRLEIENLVGTKQLLVSSIDFDVSRLSGSRTVGGVLAGNLNEDEATSLSVEFQVASLDDFDLSVSCSQVSAEDVNAFLPESRQFVQKGDTAPVVRVSGNPDHTISLSVESRFADIQLKSQPDYIPPLTGTLRAYGAYNPDTRTFQVSMARAESEALDGNVTGSVIFSDGSPQLDLVLRSSKLPVKELINSLLSGRIEKYGELEYTVLTIEDCALAVTGTVEAPAMAARASGDGAEIRFTPKDVKYPRVNLEVGRFDLAWDSTSREPGGSIVISDGSVNHQGTGIEVTGLTGQVSLTGGKVTLNPLQASLLGQSVMASGTYELKSKSGEASLAGSLANIEKTKLATSIRNASLAGSGTVKASVKFREKSADFEADIDATQTEIGYRWWFLKPVGIGASGHLKGKFISRKSITCEVESLIAGTQLSATTDLSYNGKKWSLRKGRADSKDLDVVSVGKCLPLPYVITGGKGKDGFYTWERDAATEGAWKSEFGLSMDEIALRADGAEVPLLCKGVTLKGGMAGGTAETGELTLDVESARTPPLRGSKWFAPMVRDLEKYPPNGRRWTYHLGAKSLDVAPWKGTDFKGEAYSSDTDFGLASYSATVDKGTVKGSYASRRKENAFESTAHWENVSAAYLMDTLQLPHVFRGDMSGEVTYSQDRDDPGTLRGSGYFKMKEGQFSADYILAMLEQQMESTEEPTLPPSLRFSSLEADIEFEKDVVKTPRIELTSDAITMGAEGQFVTDGDMNYTINVSVTPDAAERIPLLAQSFNVQGYRLAQQNIELAFTLSGPTLRPVSALSEAPPVHVTLVSGALEAANEAIRVFDAPRKILVDLLKIGGGIVGARKQ
ncbi:MAG: hypothetical protein IT364_13710 [Candidatus Hydrogenedentes bacterium]|nr:hypothetical protein [Candidatus Hydrogenedentota bacterium]